MQQAKREWEVAVDSLDQLILLVNADDIIVRLNRAVERWTPFPLKSALGRYVHDLLHPLCPQDSCVLEHETARLLDKAREGKAAQHELYDPALAKHLLIQVRPLESTGDDGAVAALIFHDLTAQRQGEEELRRAKATAESAARTRSEFLANMSHEIRTPMNAVIGMTNLLQDTQLSALQTDYVETIRNSGEGLLRIINDILDFSKIDSDRLELEGRPFSLQATVEDVLDLLVQQATEKGIDLAYTVDPQTPDAIVGDAVRLRQILVNLMGNAIKFTEHGHVLLSVEAEGCPTDADPHERDHCRLHFAVRDTGIGIPAEQQARLFHAFSQVDASTSRRYGGTGLGLAISKRLVEMMGGRIWVESAVGDGSTFHFTIRVMAGAEEPDGATSRGLAGRRLLLLERDPFWRQLLVEKLHGWGMAPVAVAHAEDALARLCAERFDLFVVDLQSVEQTGSADLCRRLQQVVRMPVVGITLPGGGAPDWEGKRVQPDAVLTKPVRDRPLVRALRHALRLDEGAPPAAPAQRPSTFADLSFFQGELRILLAEDNLVNQKVALRILQRLGLTADVVGNGQQAYETVARKAYDIVFMDLQMPALDGLQATRRIRGEASMPRQPYIIAMTADVMEGTQAECTAAGMDDYVSKPIQIAELGEAIRRALLETRENVGVE